MNQASTQTEEAFEFLVKRLAEIPPNTPKRAFEPNHAHLFIPDAVAGFWRQRESITWSDLKDEHWIPLYEAAWELARIGVLRPGQFTPGRDHETAKAFGDHWSITAFGFDWLADASKRPFVDMGRMANVLRDFIPRFGGGFGQRAVEAVRAYRAAHYLSACTMAGAAAESILLAIAIDKKRSEAEILKMYANSGGRSRVTRYVLGQATPSVKSQFEVALQVLHFWRDDASHGMATTITETEAYAAINQLLRLAQFASDRWDDLTQRKDEPERDSDVPSPEHEQL